MNRRSSDPSPSDVVVGARRRTRSETNERRPVSGTKRRAEVVGTRRPRRRTGRGSVSGPERGGSRGTFLTTRYRTVAASSRTYVDLLGLSVRGRTVEGAEGEDRKGCRP